MKTKIIKWFEENYKEYVEKMKNVTHSHDDGTPSPYHMEGSIWNHTMMVLEWLDSEKIELIFAALLHDIGKTETRIIKGYKVSFTYHENVSTILCIDILKKAKETFEELDILKTIKLIAWHGTLWTKNEVDNESMLKIIDLKYGHLKDFYKDFVTFVQADALGRILATKEDEDFVIDQVNFFSNYTPYDKMAYKEKPKKEVIFMVGLSGSGKSTWIEKNKLNHIVISVDKHLEKGKLAYDSKNYKKEVKKGHDLLIKEMHDLIAKEENVIVDMTNLSIEKRRKKLSKFPSTKYHKKAIVFLNDLETIKNRLNNRNGKKLNMDIIKSQIFEFELPNYNEFDEIDFIL